jgi:hypothetical protein
MAGKRRLKGRRPQAPQHRVPHRAIEVVDARTLLGHFLTLDAFAAGQLPDGRYIALCGEDVLPCTPCRTAQPYASSTSSPVSAPARKPAAKQTPSLAGRR